MWKLKQPTEELKDWYVKEMLPALERHIRPVDNPYCKLSPTEQDILYPVGDNSILEKLLILKPKEHKEINDELMVKIFAANGLGERDYGAYLSLYNNQNKNKNEKDFVNKCNSILKRLLYTFDYQGQISQNKARAYKLTVAQGYNTCTYCNRQYIFTVEEKDDNDNVTDRVVRPQLDHWFPKNCYPLLSLNLYNLIPSCSICNSSVKGTELFDLDHYVHPYLTKRYDPHFKFQYRADGKCGWSVGIIKSDDPKENKMLQAFKLEDMYSYHGNLEVKDILDWRYEYNDTYLEDLINATMKHYDLSLSEVYRMFFGTELDRRKTLDRPLSKLKRDILEQLGII